MDSINISKISSKGQVVIPKNLRSRFKEHDEVVFIERGNEIILKKSSEVLNDLNYLNYLKNTRETIERYEKNPESFESMNSDDFIQKLESKIK
jgi:AbrB family looped-hinge helix DNA binding protein